MTNKDINITNMNPTELESLQNTLDNMGVEYSTYTSRVREIEEMLLQECWEELYTYLVENYPDLAEEYDLATGADCSDYTHLEPAAERLRRRLEELRR